MLLKVRPFSTVQRTVMQQRATSGSVRTSAVTRPVLYDVPVSNNGARVRFVLYKKGLESAYDISSPASLGGLKSDAYLRLNPQGKMPLLVLPDGLCVPESEVIVQYLLDAHRQTGPSLLASTPELRAKAALVTRLHDTYIVPIQACMYRQMESPAQRAKELAQLAFQLDVLEQTLEGPFASGADITTADGALFPTMVFCDFMLPKYFGWTGLWATRPKLAAWWARVQDDPDAARIISEVRGGLAAWAAADRWKVQGIIDHVALPDYKWAF